MNLIAPALGRRRFQCYVALFFVDLISIIVGFACGDNLYNIWNDTQQTLRSGRIYVPFFMAIALYNRSYSIVALREPWIGIARVQFALIISSAALILVFFFTKSYDNFSRGSFISGVAASSVLLSFGRLQLRHFVRWRCGPSATNELIIDDGGPSLDIDGAIRISAASIGFKPDISDPYALDQLGRILRDVDRVIVSCSQDRRVDWALMLKGANVDGEVIDDTVAQLGAQGARVVGGHGLLLISAGPLDLIDRVVKRMFDIAIVILALVLLAPLLVLVALAIKFEDGGAVLFVQRRIGRGNRFFKLYKFRSMTEARADQDGAISASKGDLRITSVGKFIRSTSIDELPQLFNVLIGDMSIVGPRPHAIGSVAGSRLFWEIDERYWQRHCLKPGLSGLAQVRGFRGATEQETDLINRLQSDLEYLEGWSIWRDIKIVLLTARVLMHDRAF